jgi:glycosyltransferase involved in cell wall biosynthesis
VDTAKYRFHSEEREKVREELNIDDQTLVLGAFSRLVLVKRIDRLIRAFADVCRSRQDVKLLVAGDGPERSDLKSLAHALRLGERIRFLGQREDIARLYSALDIFCLSSKAEGMSNSLLEAMATSLPVIASDIPSNRELVDEGQGGYLIDFGQGHWLKEKVDILRDEGLRKTMGAYNREKAASRFSIKIRVEKEFQIYQDMLT